MEELAPESVYVVALNIGTPAWSTISWHDIVVKRRKYFHPIGRKNFPREPERLLGFRYNAYLLSINRVEDVSRIECRSELSKYFPEIDGEAVRQAYDQGERLPHFIYSLGEPEVHRIPTGKGIFGPGHNRIDHDLLLSCSSVGEALSLTRQRRSLNLAHGGSLALRPRSSGVTSTLTATTTIKYLLPPIEDAESLIARIALLAGLPERNHEDAVKELLLRLGHSVSNIVFQVGRIDLRITNDVLQTLAVVEVKRSIANAPELAAARRQGMDYAGQTGAAIVVVSDGDRYVIYDRRKRSYDEMLLGNFRLSAFLAEDNPALDLLRPRFLTSLCE